MTTPIQQKIEHVYHVIRNNASSSYLIHNLDENVTKSACIAVSKHHAAERIEEALKAGHRVFGENKVQEALHKWPSLKKEYDDIILHLIGPLQTNKTDDALHLFDRIDTLDRPKLARSIAKSIAKGAPNRPLLIQVNIGKEPQKSGVFEEDFEEFYHECVGLNLQIEGVMCIPPKDEDPRPYFRSLAALAQQHHLKVVSMGMSNDYEEALQCGATEVRVGSFIFGTR